jgi:FkbM family methyltransferase
MLTAAVRDLHAAAPGRFRTDVRTSAADLWQHNPHLTPLREGKPGVEVIDMHYPLIHQSQRPYHFLHGFADYLEHRLGLSIPVTRFQGDIHLAPEEKRTPPALGVDLPEHFWILMAGGKYDFTAKWWDPDSFQRVVDHFRGRIAFVQCGEQGHWHPRLKGVADLVGKTTLRDFVRLMHFADGVLCPVTFAMHLAAAVETRPGRPRVRPCVVVAGGREPPHWEAYPQHQFLSTVGALPCCAEGGCWRSRCQPVGDGDDKDRHNRCDNPVQVRPDLRIPRCMHLITPEDVIRRIELYFQGGALAPPPAAPRGGPVTMPVITEPHSPSTAQATRLLIKFRHGLGDAMQLTTVLQHLRHYHPDWEIDVAALVGKHSAFHDLCRRVFVLDREEIPQAGYDRVLDLDWPECPACYADSPSTKVERCLREVFHLQPLPELCTYTIWPCERSLEVASRYLEDVCGVAPDERGRYPVVLLHYEGNTSARDKNLPVELAREICREVLDAGAVPVILDWDNRTPLADGKRIHQAHVALELWGGTGTGDAEALAALTELSTLMVGVDSGPLHVAGATSTPTIGVWTGHHPLHYFGHADNITHLVPEDHARLLRGDRAAGLAWFRDHYRHQTYRDLARELPALVRDRLRDTGGLVFTRGFWIRTDNAAQDLVVVQDVAEQDCYRVEELPMALPVVVDVGAHIGCFAARLHRRNPLARILAVECCPENLAALRRNVGGFATVIQAAVTYEPDVALLNAVFPGCDTTGGSIVLPRSELEHKVRSGSLAAGGADAGHYWADFRPVRTLTLEQLLAEHGLDHIDVLKLDCEGSEFSILGKTTLLDRIGVIVGEYHGKEAFLRLVAERFGGWELRIVKDGELGLFWLARPR